MQNQILQTNADELFLSVEESAALAKSTPNTFYVILCNSGSRGGKTRKRFPKNLYVRFGRKVLFIKKNFVEWLMNGAKFED